MGYLLKLARGGGLFSGVSSYGGGELVGQPYTPAYTSVPDLSISRNPQADVNAYISDLIMKYKSQYTTANGSYGLGYTDEDVMDKVMPEIQKLVASGKLPASMVGKALSSETLIDSDTLSNPKYQIPGVQTGGTVGGISTPKTSIGTVGRRSMTSTAPAYTMHYSPKKKLAEQEGSYVNTTTGERAGTQIKLAPSTIKHPASIKPQAGTGTYVRDQKTGELYTTSGYNALQAQRAKSVKPTVTPKPAPTAQPAPSSTTVATPKPAPTAQPAPALTTAAAPTPAIRSAAPTASTAPAPATTPVAAPVPTSAPALKPASTPKPAAPALAPVQAPKLSRRQQYEADGWQMDTENTYGKNWMYKDTVGANGKTTRTYLSPNHRKAGRGGIQVELPSTPKANAGRRPTAPVRR